MTVHKIDINMDIKCRRCGKGGATQGGYCLSCVLKNMEEGKYDDIFDKHRANQPLDHAGKKPPQA